MNISLRSRIRFVFIRIHSRLKFFFSKSEDEQVVGYLLGELSEKRRAALERRFCVDGNLFDRMESLRDDLIDDYLREELPPKRRERFERYFLATPQQREQIENARLLMEVIEETAIEEDVVKPQASLQIETAPAGWLQKLLKFFSNGPIGIGLAVATLLLAALTGPSFFKARRLQYRLDQAQTRQSIDAQLAQERNQRIRAEQEEAQRLRNLLDQAQTRLASIEAQLAQERNQRIRAEQELANQQQHSDSPSAAYTIASIDLYSDYVEGNKSDGGGRKTLSIPMRPGLIELRLALADDNHSVYLATIKEVTSGETVITVRGMRAKLEKVVIARFSSERLSGAARDYIVELKGKNLDGIYKEIDKYSFRVQKK